MASRIKAIRSTFHLTLSIIEIIIAVALIVKTFSQDGTMLSIAEDVGDVIAWVDYGSSSLTQDVNIRGPGTMLVVVAGFMVFAYILITVVPKTIDKREKEYDLDDTDAE